MFEGILEAAAGVVLIVIPEPASTAAGYTLLADGVRRCLND